MCRVFNTHISEAETTTNFGIYVWKIAQLIDWSRWTLISWLFSQGSGNVVLQRAADGTPVQWFIAEDAEIVSQV